MCPEAQSHQGYTVQGTVQNIGMLLFLFSEDYLLKETPGMRASQATRFYPLPGASREEKRNFCIYLTLPSHSSPMWMKSLCSCKFPWGRVGQNFWIRLRRGNPITPTATVLCSDCRVKSSRGPVEMAKKSVFNHQCLFFPVLVSPDSWYFAVPQSCYFLAASSCCWHLHFMFWVRHPCYIGTHTTIFYGQ